MLPPIASKDYIRNDNEISWNRMAKKMGRAGIGVTARPGRGIDRYHNDLFLGWVFFQAVAGIAPRLLWSD